MKQMLETFDADLPGNDVIHKLQVNYNYYFDRLRCLISSMPVFIHDISGRYFITMLLPDT